MDRARERGQRQIDRQTEVFCMCRAMRQKVWEHAKKQNCLCLMGPSAYT